MPLGVKGGQTVTPTSRSLLSRLATGATLALLVGAVSGCGDDGPSASDVADNPVQACADELGLDADDFAQFSDIDSFSDYTNAAASDSDLADFDDAFNDEYADESQGFEDQISDAFVDQYSDDLEDATDVEDANAIIEEFFDSDEYQDLYDQFGNCDAFIRVLAESEVANALDDQFSTFTGDDSFTGNDSFTGSGDSTGFGSGNR
jgi:hypothetical protein